MEIIKCLCGVIRLPFLALAVVCVFLGFAVAFHTGNSINYYHLLIAVIGAIAAHASVNALNEYNDFKSGLDLMTLKTPFSGGSGILPDRPEFTRATLQIATAMFFVTTVAGLYFIYIYGWKLAIVSISGLSIIFLYSKVIVKSPLLSLITPGLGFGPLMVMGTQYVLIGNFSWNVFVASLVPFFLVNNLLLLNQFPDIGPDRKIGRKNVVVIYGLKAGCIIYSIFLMLSYSVIIIGVLNKIFPFFVLLSMVTILIAVPTIIGAFRNRGDVLRLGPCMGMNVILNLAIPFLMAIGFIFSKSH